VSAAAWIPVDQVELWRDGDAVAKFDVTTPATDGVRFQKTWDLPVEKDAVLLAWAEGKKPLPPVLPYPDARSMAFTSLVSVDADGDGRVVLAASTSSAPATSTSKPRPTPTPTAKTPRP
jgi:hypothetical protein